MNTPFHKVQTIELLAPARDVECAKAAIMYGADAVYIGGPGFGARSAAGNSVEDIARICDFAHFYGVRIYVTLNTILYDDETAEAERLVWRLYRAGVDALIVQDVSLLKMDLPPIALHASTQMDNCTVEKAQLLEAMGFSQIVLARETTLEQTRCIAEAVKVPIEAFVHGALCVSYSGRCYASQHCFARSANRGRCAQFCRLPFDLLDEDGNVMVENKYLLSLRDMNRSASLEEMMDAGVSSFKIEGRLKGADYVKNVTAYYRRKIDEVLARREDYRRTSFGTSAYDFTPDVARSFNRRFTEYFLHGRRGGEASLYTPKAVGQEIGVVERSRGKGIEIKLHNRQISPIVAGDGLCYVDKTLGLCGFRVNKAEGGMIYPSRPLRIDRGVALYRSLDHAFERTLDKAVATRTLWVDLTLRETERGYAIDAASESGCSVCRHFTSTHEPARTPQAEALHRTLSKWGDTAFVMRNLQIQTSVERFIPASVLATWRREVCDSLVRAHRIKYVRDRRIKADDERVTSLLAPSLPFTANVANKTAEGYYREHGVKQISPAFEKQPPKGEAVIMTCKHCIRHTLGICLKKQGKPGQLFLRSMDGRRFALHFDCRRCEMQVVASRN